MTAVVGSVSHIRNMLEREPELSKIPMELERIEQPPRQNGVAYGDQCLRLDLGDKELRLIGTSVFNQPSYRAELCDSQGRPIGQEWTGPAGMPMELMDFIKQAAHA